MEGDGVGKHGDGMAIGTFFVGMGRGQWEWAVREKFYRDGG